MFCTECGLNVAAEWKHCPKCGQRIVIPAAAEPDFAMSGQPSPARAAVTGRVIAAAVAGSAEPAAGTPQTAEEELITSHRHVQEQLLMVETEQNELLDAFRANNAPKVTLFVTSIGVALAAVAFALACVHRINIVDKFERSESASASAALQAVKGADDAVSLTAEILALVMLVGLVILIVWLYRGAKNNELWSETAARFGPGWVIGAWFIPLANLVLPPLVLRDVWRRSFGRRLVWNGGESKAAWLVPWWVLAIGSGIALRIRPTITNRDALRAIDWAYTTGAVAIAISWALLIWVVEEIDKEQYATLAFELEAIAMKDSNTSS